MSGTETDLLVEAVSRQDPGRVFLQVVVPEALDLQHIYRAALSIYWEPAAQELQDRYLDERSSLASAERMARALREEYGIVLKPSPGMLWIGFDEETRAEVASALFR